jgi:hypothetical protein
MAAADDATPPPAEALASFRRHYAVENGRNATFFPRRHRRPQSPPGPGPAAWRDYQQGRSLHRAAARTHGLAPFFDVIVSGDVLPRPKPDPMPLLWASGRLGVSPVDVLMIGDSLHDFHAGRAAGCHVFLVPYGYNEGRDVHDLRCDGIVSTLAEAAQRLSSRMIALHPQAAPRAPACRAEAWPWRHCRRARAAELPVAARPPACALRTSFQPQFSCGVPMTEAYFNRLAAEGYNRIPVTLETFADLDTPLSIYLKLANGPYTYLLESVQGGERFGRYSIIGLASPTRIVVNAHQVLVLNGNRIAEREDDTNPLDFIGKYMKRFRAAPTTGLPRFCGGLVGCFGYDTVRYIETRLTRSQKPTTSAFPTSCCCSPRRLPWSTTLGQADAGRLRRAGRSRRLPEGAGEAAGAARQVARTGRHSARNAAALAAGELDVRRERSSSRR